MSRPLVDKKYVLQKYGGKGGWTYIEVEEISPDKRQKGGWVQVSGSIDHFELKQYKLMPMKNGHLFFPIKAEVRKKIRKEANDTVHLVLYIDNGLLETPEEFNECLQEDAKARRFFHSLSDSEKRHYIDWIYSSKKEETKVVRMAATLNRLNKGMKRYDL